MPEPTEDLLKLEARIRASAGSDPSFETNRILKREWADELARIRTKLSEEGGRVELV